MQVQLAAGAQSPRIISGSFSSSWGEPIFSAESPHDSFLSTESSPGQENSGWSALPGWPEVNAAGVHI